VIGAPINPTAVPKDFDNDPALVINPLEHTLLNNSWRQSLRSLIVITNSIQTRAFNALMHLAKEK
jgi:hypothetical protein